MYSLRNVTRRAPQSLRRFSTTPTFAWRNLTLRTSRDVTSTAARRAAFSTSLPHRSEALVAKLQSELAIENDIAAEEPSDSAISEYLASSPYQLQDTKGSDEVTLVRKFGEEEVKITFSTESLRGDLQDPDGAVDPAMEDEEGGNAQKEFSEEEDGDQFGQGAAAHIPVNVQISKPGKGAMVIACYLDPEARFMIEHVAYHPSKELAEAKTPQADIDRRQAYLGPTFEELDDELQTMFDEFLRERDIDDSLAVFIPQYIEKKETSEYLEWLKNVKGFLE